MNMSYNCDQFKGLNEPRNEFNIKIESWRPLASQKLRHLSPSIANTYISHSTVIATPFPQTYPDAIKKHKTVAEKCTPDIIHYRFH